jgi:hypothetical protein
LTGVNEITLALLEKGMGWPGSNVKEARRGARIIYQ